MGHHYRYGAHDLELWGAVDVARADDVAVPVRVLNPLMDQIPTPYARFIAENAAGVRIRFVTAATRVELALTTYRTAYTGQEPFPAAVDLLDGREIHTRALEGGAARIDHLSGTVEYEEGEVQRVVFEGLRSDERVLELWLPHTAKVGIVELVTDAPARAEAGAERVRWVHYGSSISHSGLSTSPALTWPGVAARELDWDHVNMGMSGNAMLDPYAARTIRDTPADLITLKVGINLINYDSMTLRTFVPALHGFLDTIREGKETTPILLISPIACAAVEDAPGPTSVDMTTYRGVAWQGDDVHGADALTQSRIRGAIDRVAGIRNDPHLFTLDGRRLFSESDDASGLTVDGLHPNADGTELIGRRFASIVNDLVPGLRRVG